MNKTILITGATDGLGLETAKALASKGNKVLLHGRSRDKLAKAQREVAEHASSAGVGGLLADLSHLDEVRALAATIRREQTALDVLINNAGIFRTPHPMTDDGLDVRFVVNTLAPYVLTRELLPLMSAGARVVNLSSAAQAPVDLRAMSGEVRLADEFAAYAQSKLALTMWTRHLADGLGEEGPMVVAVNPGSLLATKMVKEGFGMAGNDIGIGAQVLCRAALDDEFADAGGRYFDNDAGDFGPPHPDALDGSKREAVVAAIEATIERLSR